MIERRDYSRRRVCLGGMIETAAYLPEVPCIVHSVSLSGARIRVSPEAILPDRIVLRIATRDECRLGRVVWRSGDMVGLHFAPDATGDESVALYRKIKASEVEIARLKAALCVTPNDAVH